MRLICFMILAVASYLVPLASQAGEARSVNFIIFMNDNPNVEYDPIMFGSFSQFIKAMDGSQVLLLSHSASVLGGDVLNLQQDVLKSTTGGHFSDVGVNCQLSYFQEAGEYNVGGNCQIIDKFHGEQLTLQAKIPRTELPDMAQGKPVWIEVYEDARTGIAFYANISNR
ncbi:MAG: hypothetical protein AUJ57_04465 [Zetaproteobacteria bacterium CG1_02_53_45]|nr:MAG: hypothetical protein AUJ57_04465 [Zetaproteobacteria bacterium CG1_02_53_45]